ncbi:MAG: hybrid sensor histidine kinase/response regulator [Desulfobacterales bacterium]|nr:hybrid sensor histidine kinase/response regulator [Desulfobacterales bacterium]
MNILVVDDERVQIESVKRGLKSKGHKVLEALSAEEALKYLNNGTKVDLILTDYSMPKMNGLELLKKIRKVHGSLPVIMMTAYAEKNLVIEALRNRCDSFMEKPFTVDQLIREIESARMRMIQNTDSDQLSELIPEFLHQINNPLMSILGSAELAMLALDSEEAVKKFINDIIEATKKIRMINKQLLTLGQTTDDKIEKVNMIGLLDECLNMFRGLLALKGVSVEKDFGGHELCLFGDKFALEQLFKNLILNAIDSMDGRHEKLLKVRAAANKNTSSVSIYIEDAGCGIPSESIDKIFTPYFTRKEGGTGLGLTIVKRIVEKHRGVIRVCSQVGKGTTLKVSFPGNCGS